MKRTIISKRRDSSKLRLKVLMKQIRSLNQDAVFFRGKDPQRSLSLSLESFDLSKTQKDLTSEAESSLNVAFAYFQLSQFNESLKYLHKATRLLSSINNEELLIQCYQLFGNIYTMTCDLNQAMHFYRESMRVAKQIGDRKSAARALANIGTVSEKKGEYTIALQYSLEALKIFQELKDAKAEAATLRNIGVMYEKLSDYPTSLSYYIQSLRVREKLGDEKGMALCLNSIGVVYYKQINQKEAIISFNKCLAIFRKLKDFREEATTLCYIGTTYIDSERYNEAISALQESLKIRKEISDEKGIALSTLEIGKVYTRTKKFKAAQKAINDALARFRLIGDRYKTSEALLNLGELFHKQKQYKQALRVLLEALTLAQEINAKSVIMNIQDRLSQVYSDSNQKGLALKHFQLRYKLEKEIFNEESDKRLKLAHINFEVEKKEKENELLRQKLALKEKELRSFSKYLIEEAATKSDVMERLLDIKRRVASGELETIDQHLAALENQFNPDKTWETFEREFKKAHPHFLTYLSRKFPLLSPTELKICAMLKLGRTTKEISRLLFISTNTALEHRSNIRKKCGLNVKENLSSFISRL